MKALLCAMILSLAGAAAFSEDAVTIRVAAAANLSGTLEKLALGFESRSPAAKVEAVYASSGALAAQIRASAPYDLFLSADLANPRGLEGGPHAAGQARVYALGVLCVASSIGVDESGSLAFLSDARYRSIALAKPELAPYGLAAQQALKASGLLESLGPRLVFGNSVGQVNQFVESGASDAGFVNLSAALVDPAYTAPGRPGIAWCRVAPRLYEPIAQAAILLTGDGSQAARGRARVAAAFLDFILSGEGHSILEKAGYEAPR